MNNLFEFIFSRVFKINFAIAIVVIILLVFGTLQYIKSYSLHGQTITVPDLKGMHFDQLNEVLEERNLRYTIVDSVYSDSHKPGAVVNQNPEPETQVKENRTIYLTVNAVLPPLVTVRDMAGLSRRQALSIIEVIGLRVDSMSYRPDICLDCVLDVLYRGKTIKGGTKIKKGSKVTLILGAGKEGRVLLPDFYGLSYTESIKIIESNLMTPGAVLGCEGCITSEDTAMAKVYRQIPPYFENNRATIGMGQPIDFFLTLDTLELTPRELPGENIESESESESEFE